MGVFGHFYLRVLGGELRACARPHRVSLMLSVEELTTFPSFSSSTMVMTFLLRVLDEPEETERLWDGNKFSSDRSCC